MNFWDIIKSIYLKTKYDFEPNTGLNISITKCLSLDIDNSKTISKIFPYIFYLTPKFYYKLLWLNIPQKSKVPYIPQNLKIKKEQLPPNNLQKLIKEVQCYFNWSNNELSCNKFIVEKQLLSNIHYWQEEFGIDV